ncbi:hypothetical protein [Bacillus suaedae]|uniref:Uncharacterized protein n=1 Tax=Halalkalibacter suaedae TaxID=2822140 RepID=A0A941ANW0_9BACI|nr:hypothetical protein [Bacillus suaedae]MBP3949528.1 hypothetical protein [Bacillus suaedae]
MTKIQLFQLLSIAILAILLVLDYQFSFDLVWILYLLLGLNLLFWVVRQLERKKQKESE